MSAPLNEEQQAACEKVRAFARRVGAQMLRIWPCHACGQKNRIDAAEMIARAAQPKCGACGTILRYRPPEARK